MASSAIPGPSTSIPNPSSPSLGVSSGLHNDALTLTDASKATPIPEKALLVKRPFVFLDFPTEIRHKIYKYHFAGGIALMRYQTFDMNEWTKIPEVALRKLQLNIHRYYRNNILLACRFIYQEARQYEGYKGELYVNDQTHRFQEEFGPELHHVLPTHFLANVVDLYITMMWTCVSFPAVLYPKLRTVTIRIENVDDYAEINISEDLVIVSSDGSPDDAVRWDLVPEKELIKAFMEQNDEEDRLQGLLDLQSANLQLQIIVFQKFFIADRSDEVECTLQIDFNAGKVLSRWVNEGCLSDMAEAKESPLMDASTGESQEPFWSSPKLKNWIETKGMKSINPVRSLTERERSMTDRERELMGRELSLTDQERSLAERERSLAERERSLAERERSLMERERSLTERKSA